ncbi:hypothetical protein MR475_01290 [bacterium]|nr:hypothetical protein [bacterium]MCI6083723.1 hypothetical protein [bacterium]MCI6175559.1 hypothetical protein [bacterium]MCI7744944.1 hypothetical protein [bacterium]MCI7794449.1 hypothetical protein [bacterium]
MIRMKPSKEQKACLKKILAVLRVLTFCGVWAYAIFAPSTVYSNRCYSYLLVLPALFNFLYTLWFDPGPYSRRQELCTWGILLLFAVTVGIRIMSR